jgi:hypothetical protein
MKKLMILLAVACLIFVSCCNKTEKAIEPAEETTCTLTPEQELMFVNWENWEDLDLEQQEALVGEMKAFLDECKAKCEGKCPMKEESEGAEVCPEKAAKCAEFKAKWEAFEELELDAKKELLDCTIAHISKCCNDKEEGCCKKDQEGCKKDKKGCAKE